MSGQTLLTLLIMGSGCGLFLRLVAKEKRRREKHLELRLTEQMKELEERARRQREDHPKEAEP